MLRDEAVTVAATLDLIAHRGPAGSPNFDEDAFSAALAACEEVDPARD